uniref:Zinc finger protein n=1 Tax=Anisakis simplex TaxID=6269 RepID=A0A0M3J5A7_ANISI
LSSSPEDSFASRKDVTTGNSHLRPLNNVVNNSYSISKLLEKKEPSTSSRASSSSVSDDDNVSNGRCRSTDDEPIRSASTHTVDIDRVVASERVSESIERNAAAAVWPHLFAAGPSAFTIPQNGALADPSAFASAVAAAAASAAVVAGANPELAHAQQLQNAYLSYLLSSSLSSAHPNAVASPLRVMASPHDNNGSFISTPYFSTIFQSNNEISPQIDMLIAVAPIIC